MAQPEDKARENIDRMLTQAGWAVCETGEVHISAFRGLAIRNFSLGAGHGEADYLLYVDSRAAESSRLKKDGVITSSAQ